MVCDQHKISRAPRRSMKQRPSQAIVSLHAERYSLSGSTDQPTEQNRATREVRQNTDCVVIIKQLYRQRVGKPNKMQPIYFPDLNKVLRGLI